MPTSRYTTKGLHRGGYPFRVKEAQRSCSLLPSKQMFCEGLHALQCEAGQRGSISWIVHAAWTGTTAAAVELSIAAAGATTTGGPTGVAALPCSPAWVKPFSVRGRGSGGASSTDFSPVSCGRQRRFSGETAPSGACATTAFLPQHPCPSSATAPASISMPAAEKTGIGGRTRQRFWWC